MSSISKKSDLQGRGLSSQEGKYLTFMLENESYGIEILKVKEIIGMIKFTSIPRTPDFVKGVINLRGKVIPIIDLRLKFSMPEIDYAERTCIIVVEIDTQDSTVMIGIVVDSVSEVMNIQAEQIEPTPEFGTGLDTAYISGMAKVDGSVKILLDIDRILSARQIEALKHNA